MRSHYVKFVPTEPGPGWIQSNVARLATVEVEDPENANRQTRRILAAAKRKAAKQTDDKPQHPTV